MPRSPLTPTHVAAVAAAGKRRHCAAGEMLTTIGTPIDHFSYVVDGDIEMIEVTRADMLRLASR